MAKLLFAPLGIASGILAGIVAKKGFERLWSAVDRADPPAPDQRDTSYPKLIAALAVEGAVFRVTKGVVDQASRRAFEGATGRWPGEDPAAD
jgi:hypothetical protein